MILIVMMTKMMIEIIRMTKIIIGIIRPDDQDDYWDDDD